MDSREKLNRLKEEIGKAVIGQQQLVDGFLVGLLCGGHVLLEGRPGLAKTLAARTLARCIGGSFSRVQFTPDLLPSDIVGYQAYHAEERRLETVLGPIAANLVLADEINRAPAKVQSALLEAMQEHQVTIAGTTYCLPEPYMVIATQNPLEQQGTYPLPEAQKDRFLLRVCLGYPSREEEARILESSISDGMSDPECCLSCAEILELCRQRARVQIDERISEYLLDIVIATRPGQSAQLSQRQNGKQFCTDELVRDGVSPRAALALLNASQARAVMDGRKFIIPEDVRSMVIPVLAHRIIMSYDADAKRISAEEFLTEMLDGLNMP